MSISGMEGSGCRRRRRATIRQPAFLLLWLALIKVSVCFLRSPLLRQHVVGKQHEEDPASWGRSPVFQVVADNQLSAPPSPLPQAVVDDTTMTTMRAFDTLASNLTHCLVQSDLKRGNSFDGASSGWTSWVDSDSAVQFQTCFDQLVLANTNVHDNDQDQQQSSFFRWIKACPAPLVMDLSHDLRSAVNGILKDDQLVRIESTRDEVLSRIAFRWIALPSGGTLATPLVSPPGAMVYGKLLWGGVTRYRLLPNRRKAGERTLIMTPNHAATATRQPLESWLQYGGPHRNYQAVDMGPCLVMEVIILPKGLQIEPVLGKGMMAEAVPIHPRRCFDLGSYEVTNATATSLADNNETMDEPLALVESQVETAMTLSLGGLEPQIQEIVRRVMEGRGLFLGETQKNDTTASATLQDLLDLGLEPVRGLLLYGPPGCGKTALAREMAQILKARPPKIVAAPELLDRWVGGSEKLVRQLFADAEAELTVCGGDPTRSGLHVVVIDEIDAVFRRRSSNAGSSEVTRASAVNQILAKLDGVKALGNVLVIGMTNRKELLDPALLRPGRLEVHVEIPLPDQQGRRQILQIHFQALRAKGRLSLPLCAAVDGTTQRFSSQQGRLFPWQARDQTIRDLAADRWTGGFSGADLEGLVRCAGSIALARARKDGSGIDGLLITTQDVLEALNELK